MTAGLPSQRIRQREILTRSKEENVSQGGLETGEPRSILVKLGTSTQGAADVKALLLGDVTLKGDSGQQRKCPLPCK